MSTVKKEAILVVSFGTSYEETRKLTIDAIEKDIAEAFKRKALYSAWTSKMIRNKIKAQKGIDIPGVTEALQQMKKEGITDVIIQPTHVINGVENEQMLIDAKEFIGQFQSLKIGDPLLTTKGDNQKVIEAVAEEFLYLDSEEALVLMGHGTTHYSNAIYAALDYEFKDRGYKNIYLGTVEAYPGLPSIFRMLKESGTKKVCLAPFMIVAGDHAQNDLSGGEEDSWYSLLSRNGYEVRCVLKGLGEYKKIRELFIEHILRAAEFQKN